MDNSKWRITSVQKKFSDKICVNFLAKMAFKMKKMVSQSLTEERQKVTQSLIIYLIIRVLRRLRSKNSVKRTPLKLCDTYKMFNNFFT